MDTSKSTQAAVVALCNQFVARSMAQGLKGKARDREAVAFTVGAAALANCIGDSPLYSACAFLALMVSTRGFSEIERRVKDSPSVNAIEMRSGSVAELTTAFDVQTVVAIGGDCYGVGKSINEATRNMKRENSRAVLRALRFYECERSQLRFECGVDLTILAPKDAKVARLAITAEG